MKIIVDEIPKEPMSCLFCKFISRVSERDINTFCGILLNRYRLQCLDRSKVCRLALDEKCPFLKVGEQNDNK